MKPSEIAENQILGRGSKTDNAGVRTTTNWYCSRGCGTILSSANPECDCRIISEECLNGKKTMKPSELAEIWVNDRAPASSAKSLARAYLRLREAADNAVVEYELAGSSAKGMDLQDAMYALEKTLEETDEVD